jgi:hypothetical protein
VSSIPFAGAIRKPPSPNAATMRAAKASGLPRRLVDCVRDDPFDGRGIDFRHFRSPGFLGANIGPHPAVAERGLAGFGKPPYLREMMLDLTEKETDALAKLLSRTIDDDRYPLSPRIQTLKAVLAKIRPAPAREPCRRGRSMRHREHQPLEGTALGR